MKQKSFKRSICSHCGNPECDGRAWLVKHQEFIVCTSGTEIVDGQRVYRYVRGHGEAWWEPVEPAPEGA